MQQGLELGGHDHVDQDDGQQQGEAQIGEGFLAQLFLAGHGKGIFRRQGKGGEFPLDPGGDLVEGAFRGQVGADGGDARLVAAGDGPRGKGGNQAGHLVEPHPAPLGGFEQDALELVAGERGRANDDVGVLALVLELAGAAARKQVLHLGADRFDTQGELRGRGPVDLHVDLGPAGREAGLDIGQLVELGQALLHLLGQPGEQVQVPALDFHHQRGRGGAQAGLQRGLLEHEAGLDMGQGLQLRAQGRDQGPRRKCARWRQPEIDDGAVFIGEHARGPGLAAGRADTRVHVGEVRADALLKEGFQVAHRSFGARQAGPLGQGEVDGEFALLRPRHELAAHRGQEERRAGHQEEAGQQHHQPAPEQGPEQAGVPGKGDRAGRHGRGRPGPQPRAEHGDDHQGDEERGEQRKGHGPRLLTEEFPGGPVQVHDGQEDHDGGQGGAGDGPAHLAGPLHRGLGRGCARFEMAGDVLHHHDGIVHQHARAQGQPAQGHDVEREVVEVHQVEGGDDGDRDGQADHGGDPDPAQEHVEHHHGQEDADQPGLLDLGYGRFDEAGLVLDHLQLVPGQDPPQAGQLGADAGDRVDGVEAGFLEEFQADAAPAVEADDVLGLVEDVAHLGHLAQVDGNAPGGGAGGPLRDNEVFEFLRGGEFSHPSDEVAPPHLDDGAAGHVPVGALNGGSQLLQGQSVGFQGVRVGLDLHLAAAGPHQLDRGDSGQPDQLVADDVLGGLAQRVQVVDGRMGKGRHHHGPGIGIVLADRDLVRLQALAEVGHGLLQIQEGFVHVHLPAVFDRDEGPAGLRGRCQALHAPAAGGDGFQGDDELLLHLLGGAFPGHDFHEEPGVVQRGKEIHAQALEGDVPQQSDRQDEHQHGSGIVD